ncbi:hypothetical protein HPB51_029334 [Rhipicephalus microplus]|uniref:Uncharacterized protein n=1 Tax=Rhipicephalus microplus TaxID=6941 RepID=A0A9J6CUW6_RHIMP|nr:hypothetical protein HPB51_029334 [Rhipicephalus microplus]
MWRIGMIKKSALEIYRTFKQEIAKERIYGNTRGSILFEARTGVLRTKTYRAKYEGVDTENETDDSDSSVYSDLGSDDDSSELEESADEGDISSEDESDEGCKSGDEQRDEFTEEPDNAQQQTDDESEDEETTKMKFHGGKEEDFVFRKKTRNDGPEASYGKRSVAVAKQEDVKIDSLGAEVAKVDEYAFDSSDEEGLTVSLSP